MFNWRLTHGVCCLMATVTDVLNLILFVSVCMIYMLVCVRALLIIFSDNKNVVVIIII